MSTSESSDPHWSAMARELRPRLEEYGPDLVVRAGRDLSERRLQRVRPCDGGRRASAVLARRAAGGSRLLGRCPPPGAAVGNGASFLVQTAPPRASHPEAR